MLLCPSHTFALSLSILVSALSTQPKTAQRVLPRCFTEVMLRLANPLRAVVPGLFKGGPKGALRCLGLRHGVGAARVSSRCKSSLRWSARSPGGGPCLA
jgi:hypothetical protein